MNKIKELSTKKANGVLFLQGVFKKDCKIIEDMFHENLLLSHRPNKENIIYDKIPLLFTGINTWVKSTNIQCWYCTRSISGMPWTEPQSIEPVELQNAFSLIVKGFFCSVNCVKSYIDLNAKTPEENNNKTSMLKYLYKIMTNNEILHIQKSPHYTRLLQYGGDLSSSEYQRLIDESNLFEDS
jgi:hypothetical protein